MTNFELYTRFFRYNKNSPLEPTSYTLFMALLGKWIENNLSPFECSTNDILKEVNMSKATVNRTKVLLKEIGLIKYSSEPGGKSKYTVLTLFDNKDFDDDAEKTANILPPNVEGQSLKEEKIVNPKSNKKSQNDKELAGVPMFSEVLEFAKTLKLYDSSMEFHLQSKYESWIENGWKNGFGTKIKNWKSAVRNTIPYLKRENKLDKEFNIPKIEPITTYNE